MSERAFPPLTLVLWALLGVFALLLSLQEIRALDYWWHLRAGQWIVENGAVPRVDPFSYTVGGSRWIDIHWLHQVVFYAVFEVGGHVAVSVAKAICTLAVLALTASIGLRRDRPLVSILPLATMLVVMADRLGPRPELTSFVLLAAILALYARREAHDDRWIFGVVPLQLVWVNAHGLFPLAIGICGAHLLSSFVHARGSIGDRLRSPRVRQDLLLTLGVTLVVPLNPNGLEGALYPLHHLQMLAPPEQRDVFGQVIDELAPLLSSRNGMTPLAVRFVLGLAFASAAAVLLDFRRARLVDAILWVAFFALALSASRNASLFAIVAAPLLVVHANGLLDSPRGQRACAWLRSRPRLRAVSHVAVALLLIAASVDVARDKLFPRLGSSRQTGLGLMRHAYPIAAAEFVANEPTAKKLCHHMDTGGYLIWRLHPERLVMIDGRLEIYGSQLFQELQIDSIESLRKIVARYDCDTIFLQHSTRSLEPILWWLHVSEDWQLRHVDDQAAVFMRTQPGVAEVDLGAPDLFPPLEDTRPVADRDVSVARSRFYTGMRRFHKALSIWEEALERHPDLPLGVFNHALLLRATGDRARADALLAALEIDSASDARMLRRIGEARMQFRQPEAARRLLDTAIELDPEDELALLSRARLSEATGDRADAVRRYRALVSRGGASPSVERARERLAVLEAESADAEPAAEQH